MELSSDAPKTPKLPFLLGDVVLLAIAAFVASRAGAPPSTAAIVAIVICGGLGALLGVAPFILDYARQQDAQLTERQQALEALVRTTSAAAEQASIAAGGLHEIAEITKRNLRSVEELPARIEAAKHAARTKEDHQHANAVETLRADLDAVRDDHAQRLDSATQLVERLLVDLPALEARLNTHFADLSQRLAARSAARPTLSISAPTPDAPADDSAPDEATSRPKPRRPRPAPTPEPSLFEPTVEPSSPPPSETPPKPEAFASSTPVGDTSVPPAPAPDPAPDPNPAPGVEEATVAPPISPPPPARTTPPARPRAAASSPPSPAEPSASPTSDGHTRLTVTAYIGIGNRLFVRGVGPGLDPDEGIPLQFVSIGKWRWESDAVTEPVRLTLWKNDQVPCATTGTIELSPGSHLETNASF